RSLEESDILGTGLGLVLFGDSEHLIEHINTIRVAGGANPPGTQQHINAAAAAEVEYNLTLVEFGKRSGVSTAERCVQCCERNHIGLIGRVQVTGDRVVVLRAATIIHATAGT